MELQVANAHRAFMCGYFAFPLFAALNIICLRESVLKKHTELALVQLLTFVQGF